MIKVYVRADCGCCDEELLFNSVESAEKVFQEAGLGNGVCITDDTGTVHTGLDTFYGFSTDAEEQGSRGLDYLARLAFGVS